MILSRLLFNLALLFAVFISFPACADYAYKIGTPYEINGVYYYPRENFRYSEEGVASWYGPGFNKKQTANGETFNQNDLTAAHRTLPLPSLVKVTNLENGHVMTLVVNDRGPFVNTKNRIIDVSSRAAEILGFKEKGTARVRVEILAKESIAMRDRALQQSQSSYGSSYQTASLNNMRSYGNPWLKAAANTGHNSKIQSSYSPKGMFVQIGAYTKYENAARAGSIVFDAFNGQISPQVKPIQLNGKQCFRVRVGPFSSVDRAKDALKHLKSKGLDGSRIVQVN
jgi:rare lipoprotein A